MKKKIKDLTLKKLRNICKNHSYDCDDCPLNTGDYGCMVNIENANYEPYWEKEIEVDLSEKED